MDSCRLSLGIAVLMALGACQRSKQSDDFAAMQQRGEQVMGVNQYASAHVFEDLPDGGRVVLDRDDGADTAAINAIRAHMRDIATAFRAGDFTKPFEVHAQAVPGTAVMTAKRDAISYDVIDRPKGGEVRIKSTDQAAILAIHQFLEFQRTAHHAAGHEMNNSRRGGRRSGAAVATAWRGVHETALDRHQPQLLQPRDA